MTTSIPISSLNTEPQVATEDFVPIVNSASLTTLRASVKSIGVWMSNSGSASSSFVSTTSSFGLLSQTSVSASWTSRSLFSLSSSFASQALSSSFAISASWANTGNAVSASWASQSLFSLSSSFASQSLFSLSSSTAPVAVSASWASQSLSSSHSNTASLANNLITANLYPITASWALNSAASKASITYYSTSVNIASSTIQRAVTQYTGSLIPFNASGVILQASAFNGNTNSPGFVYISTNSSGSDARILLGYMSGGSGDVCNYAGQGFFPVINGVSSSSFWYQVTQPSDGGWEIDIVGYF